MRQRDYSHIVRSKKFQITTIVVCCLLVGATAGAISTRQFLFNKPTINKSTPTQTQTKESGALGQHSTETSTNQPVSTQIASGSTSTSNTNKSLQYYNEALAAQEQANHIKFCLESVNQPYYNTFKLTLDNTYSYTVNQSNAILANNSLSINEKNTLLDQLHSTYNTTVDGAYSTYTNGVIGAGCQPTMTTPPSHWSGT